MRVSVLSGYSAMMANPGTCAVQGRMAWRARQLEARISERRSMGTPLSQTSRSATHSYDFSEIVGDLQTALIKFSVARQGEFESGLIGKRQWFFTHADKERTQMGWLERREWDAFAGRFDRFEKAVEILTSIQYGSFWENGEDLFFGEAEAARWALKQVQDFSAYLGSRHNWARRAEQRASEKVQFPEKYFFSPLWRGVWSFLGVEPFKSLFTDPDDLV